MKSFMSLAVCCSAIFACTSDPPLDAPPDAGGSGTATQQAIEPAAQQDEAIASRDEGDDDTHWYTPIWPFRWPWHWPWGHEHKMDPEPDRNKNRRSCFDWCDWSRRQCEKWCWN